jgi:hypothetical protein
MLDHTGFQKIMKEQVFSHSELHIQQLTTLPENRDSCIRRALVWCMLSYVSFKCAYLHKPLCGCSTARTSRQNTVKLQRVSRPSSRCTP